MTNQTQIARETVTRYQQNDPLEALYNSTTKAALWTAVCHLVAARTEDYDATLEDRDALADAIKEELYATRNAMHSRPPSHGAVTSQYQRYCRVCRDPNTKAADWKAAWSRWAKWCDDRGIDPVNTANVQRVLQRARPPHQP